MSPLDRSRHPDPTACRDAALRLHGYLHDAHWDGRQLVGPDPGIRWNFRVWRFVKNYLPWITWRDTVYMLQCQGYWIQDNWRLHDLFGDTKYHDIATACAHHVLEQQHPDGYWEHPLPEWRGRIATVEGIYASLGLLYTFERTQNDAFISAVHKWYDFLISKIGFQTYRDALSVNYFAGRTGNMVPNNSTLTLTFLAELFRVTKESTYLKQTEELVKFIAYAQRQSGELPYIFLMPSGKSRDHLLCYQYNAFQFLDLARYYEITKDAEIKSILHRLTAYLRTGVNRNGSSKYTCHRTIPEVHYYSAVLGATFLEAHRLGIGDFTDLIDRIYGHVLRQQCENGRFPFSRRNYILLSDRRSYPRYQSMILKHLLMGAEKNK